MIGLEPIWNVSIQALLCVAFGGFWLFTVFCGWASIWYAIMKSSSPSVSSALSNCSLGFSGMMIWYASFGLPLYCCCDCGCAFFVKHILVKCPILLQVLHWYSFAGQLNPCVCGESPHLVHWFGFLLYDCCCYGCHCCCGLFPLFGFQFVTTFFFLGVKLVWLCLSTLTRAQPCIFNVCCLMCLAVALLDSSFLAICHSFAAGYCAKSVFPLLNVLATNLVSNIKNQKYLWWESWQFLWGPHRMECVLALHYSTHWYFCCLVCKMLTDQILHILHLIVVYIILSK